MLSPAVSEASLLRSVLADITGYQRGDLTLGLRELRDIQRSLAAKKRAP
jgi:hypothetical protein